MRYKSDYTDQALETGTQEFMPVTCGSFNSGLLPSMSRPVSPMPAAPTLPTGFPTGGSATQLIPAGSGTPAAVPFPPTQSYPSMPGQPQVPVTVESTLYTPGFLRTQIGKRMRVEFLIGTNGFTDRTGTLVAVGASYILLQPIDSDDLMLCDIYSIKFVTIIR